MEWVETTSKTIDEAKDTLLDQLGVDEEEAEFEILEEPKVGLFGRPRGEARVRARIRPKAPRPKDERRRGNSRRTKAKTGNGGDANGTATTAGEQRGGNGGGNGRRRESQGERADNPRHESRPPRNSEGGAPMETADPEEIANVVAGFLTELVTAFGVEADVSTTIDEGQIVAQIDGTDLGYLIGPKGGVVDAVQELSRTFSQKESKGKQAPRLRVDVGSYRANRKAELEEYVRRVAEDAMASGEAYAFEPMGSADRKTVHDTAATIDGLESRSEGEDPRRKVVIIPA
jgi:spoIIIJ-associated protein